MGPSGTGKTNKSRCPMCNNPYRDENMVECTSCREWFCYECVNVSDEIENDETWKCPQCESQDTPKTSQEPPSTEMNQTLRSNTGITAAQITPVINQINKDNNSIKQSTKGSSSRSKKSSTSSKKLKMKLKLLQEERELIKETRRLLDEDEESTHSQDISDTEVEQTDYVANELLSLAIEKSDLQREPNISQPLQERHTVPQTCCNLNNLSRQQSTARKSIPHELPTFDGNPHDWPLFISSYERSTELCGFDHNENLMRLQKCLRGAAKNAVSSFLILPQCVPEIISTLKILFGRSEQIIESQIDVIRRQPPPKPEKLETFVEFALLVKNMCVTLEAAKMSEYLNNPTLMHELVEKLPPQFKINWAIHRSTLQNKNSLTGFADWMFNVATNVCSALPSLVLRDCNNTRLRQKERTHVHTFEEKESKKCKICDGTCQNAAICPKFQQYSLSERWNTIKLLKLCRLCLKMHRFPCKYPVKCYKNDCQRKHHPLLHKEDDKSQETSVEVNCKLQQVPVCKEVNMVNISQDIRFRILPVIIKNGDREIKTHAFLDEGSSVTLLNESISQDLNLQGYQDQLCLQWTGDYTRIENDSKRVSFSIIGDFLGAKQFDCRSARTVSALNLPQQTLNAPELKETYPYLKNLSFNSYQNASPQILIGLDNWELAVPLRIKEGEASGQPIAAKCRLGWSVFALTQTSSPSNFNFHFCECNNSELNNEKLHEAVREYFSIESLGVKPIESIASKEVQRARKIQQTTLIHDGNRYKIGLLWKYDVLQLPDSRTMALKRLECLERRIKFNPEIGKRMNEQIEDFIRKDYVRKLTDSEVAQQHKKIWYLPMFPTLNTNKPGKFRIVWDAAASVQGVSLNSVLLKGDDQLTSLLGVLLRFRERKYGFSADIKEMFLRIGALEEDQHTQRFLWRGGSAENTLETYVISVMTFGATCSPSNAQYVKNSNAKEFQHMFPRAVEGIINNHYVDDFLDSADTEEEALELAHQVTFIHSKANFEIRNWQSNSKVLSNTMNGRTECSEVNMNIENKTNKEKVLGMWWDTERDVFIFSLKFNKGKNEVLSGSRKPTKREILQILMSIYDPLGLLANFLIYIKILLQEIWRSNISWDETIKEDQFQKWLIWLKQLPKIEQVKIPRCYLSNFQNWLGTSTQLHVFVDASEHASATVAYLRIRKEKQIECVILGAKTHVAPLKLKTIPRLELDGAVMGARFAKNMRKHLSVKIDEIFYWSDSVIVLSWLRTQDPKNLAKYVAYRVTEIQENSIMSNWRYVPTKLNAADEATRCRNQQFICNNERWFKGPKFLQEPEDCWPPDINLNSTKHEECILKHAVADPIVEIRRFGKYTKLLHTVAYVRRFIIVLQAKVKKNETPTGILTSEELLYSRNIIIKMCQLEFFQTEIKTLRNNRVSELQPTVNKNSILYKLSPYLDEEEILRVRGRIDAANCLEVDAKRPIILPCNCYLTQLILEDYHVRYLHRNHETVINEIRQKFYIPKLRRIFNKVRRNCQTCKIQLALPNPPEMAALPTCRLATYTAPFTFTGVDYFGPINVTVGRRLEKRWGALFTCLTTRGIHLEIAYKLDADSCILCFQNFMNRRGRPRHIYCDRGTNFIATERILRESLKNLNPSQIAEAFVSPEITFHFNSPLSPHMAGAWERLVKTVKISLYEALPTRNPTDQLFQSCLIAVENIVNSRPLTYLPLETEESEALTPNHFLVGSSNGDKPMGEFNDDSKVLKFNYLYREQFANKCWRRFVSEYIPKLLIRCKWNSQVEPIKEGDIVIICDKDLPRCNWPKGRVVQVIKASDGQVRRAVVQTAKGFFERPVVKLAVLSLDKEEKRLASTEGCASPGGSVKNEVKSY